MNVVQKVFCVSGATLLLSLLCAGLWGQEKPWPYSTWEYKSAVLCGRSVEPDLNSLGAQGWELVAIGNAGICSRYVLKRRTR
jgi:hypothetical protein